MPSFLKKLDGAMEFVERNVVGWATLVMVAILFINVVLRNFFHSGLVWGNELSSYLNILAVYIGISTGFKYGSHVGVSVIVDYVVPKKVRKPVAVLTEIITLIFCALVGYFAMMMCMKQMSTGQVSPVMKFPLWVVYAFIVAGMVMSCVRQIMEVCKVLVNEKGPGAQERSETV